MSGFEGALCRPEMQYFDDALDSGATIQAWQSASGLRMVRVVSPSDECWAWGKHPNIDQALINTAMDYRMGHLPNSYGEGGIHYNFMAGSQEASSQLDEHLLRDGELKSYKTAGSVVCELTGCQVIAARNHPPMFDFIQAAEADSFAEAVSLALGCDKEEKPKGHSTFTPFQA